MKHEPCGVYDADGKPISECPGYAALSARLVRVEAERDAALLMRDGFSTLLADREARLAEAERDIAQWKKVYDLRGRALQRPCINCGHVPLVIHADAARATDSADAAQEK